MDRTLAIARGVAEALGALHALGIVHRDVKPSNIILTRDVRGWELPKLLDFGIVALRESSSVTTSRPVITPAYASPEQWRGMKRNELDGRADFYSLGMTLYEMLTGRLPFHAHNIEGWMTAHLFEPPVPPSRFNAALLNWPGVDELLLELIAKDGDARPKDAQSLVLAISLLEALVVPQRSEGSRPGANRRIEPRVGQQGDRSGVHQAAAAGVSTPSAAAPYRGVRESSIDVRHRGGAIAAPELTPGVGSSPCPPEQPAAYGRRVSRTDLVDCLPWLQR